MREVEGVFSALREREHENRIEAELGERDQCYHSQEPKPVIKRMGRPQHRPALRGLCSPSAQSMPSCTRGR